MRLHQLPIVSPDPSTIVSVHGSLVRDHLREHAAERHGRIGLLALAEGIRLSMFARQVMRAGIRARHPEYAPSDVEEALARLLWGVDFIPCKSRAFSRR